MSLFGLLYVLYSFFFSWLPSPIHYYEYWQPLWSFSSLNSLSIIGLWCWLHIHSFKALELHAKPTLLRMKFGPRPCFRIWCRWGGRPLFLACHNSLKSFFQQTFIPLYHFSRLSGFASIFVFSAGVARLFGTSTFSCWLKRLLSISPNFSEAIVLPSTGWLISTIGNFNTKQSCSEMLVRFFLHFCTSIEV